MKNRFLKVSALLLAAVLALGSTGCNELREGLKAVSDMTVGLRSARQHVETLWRAGEISDAKALAFLEAEEKTLRSLKEINALIKTACGFGADSAAPDAVVAEHCPGNAGPAIRAQLDVLIPQAASSFRAMSDAGVLGIKNPDKQRALQAILLGVEAGFPLLWELVRS